MYQQKEIKMLSSQLAAQLAFINTLSTARLKQLILEAGFILGKFEMVEIIDINGTKIYVKCLDLCSMSTTCGENFVVWIEYDGSVGNIDFVQNQ